MVHVPKFVESDKKQRKGHKKAYQRKGKSVEPTEIKTVISLGCSDIIYWIKLNKIDKKCKIKQACQTTMDYFCEQSGFKDPDIRS